MKSFRMLKRVTATAGLLALMGTPVLLAQDASQGHPQTPDQSATNQSGSRHQHDGELEKLNLTDDQKAQVKKIHEDMKSQMGAVKSDTTLTEDQKHAKMKQLHRASHQQVMQLLTPEQRKQFTADEKERKAEKQQGGQTTAPQQ